MRAHGFVSSSQPMPNGKPSYVNNLMLLSFNQIECDRQNYNADETICRSDVFSLTDGSCKSKYEGSWFYLIFPANAEQKAALRQQSDAAILQLDRMIMQSKRFSDQMCRLLLFLPSLIRDILRSHSFLMLNGGKKML